MRKVIVGMSGGVDSAVAAYLLKQQGYNVVGVFLKMLEGESEFNKAKDIAKQLGIKLIIKDIKKIFRKEIIDEFVNGYESGLTPNPCVICNRRIKFKYLLWVADELRVKKIATGHYVKTSLVSGDLTTRGSGVGIPKTVLLKKARDKTKDQSYFLYRLTQLELQRAMFPLGELLKSEIKEIVEQEKLKISALESQDVCFLKNDKTLEKFLREEVKNGGFVEGNIIDEQGEIIGLHRGLAIYTIGQRKGLDVNGGPFYVVEKDLKNNILKVSREKNKDKLNKSIITIDNVNWINTKPEKCEGSIFHKIYQIKVRYQMKSVEAKLKKIEKGKWRVESSEPIWAVASGQSLVVYDEDKVVGGGIIN